jgi:circadian clock protein KaiC
VIRLEQLAPTYGAERRRMRVIKMRGTNFRGGYHDLVIRRGGLRIFPRLVAADHLREFEHGPSPSGVRELDKLLGGGLDRGTSTLLIGPSGAGKSSMALAYVRAALDRGEHVLMLSFDETLRTLLQRASGIGIDLAAYVAAGLLSIQQIDPSNVSPGELSGRIREAVERDDARMVVIDSVTGYLASMAEEQFVIVQMHEILTYLNQQGVVTVMILAQHGMVGQMASPIDLTYLSDCVVVLRFFEAEGRIRRAVSVLKKRTGAHEDAIREFGIDGRGLRVGAALTEFRGVLTGVPTFEGERTSLLKDRHEQ